MSTLNDVFKCYLSKFVLMAIYIGKKRSAKIVAKSEYKPKFMV